MFQKILNDCNETWDLNITKHIAAIERTYVRDEQNNRAFSIIVDSEKQTKRLKSLF